MPPSAGACHTTDASLNPDCGRAGPRSSTITAIGCCIAALGATSTPVSGAGTSVGVGSGVGEGIGVGLGPGVGLGRGVGSGLGEGIGSIETSGVDGFGDAPATREASGDGGSGGAAGE